MNSVCLICQRIALIKNNKNPNFVIELKAGYVVLGDHQFYKGYTLLLSKNHISEIHLLPSSTQRELMSELVLVGEAIYNLFKPKKLNYELLGNEFSHVHWHIFPRYLNDPNPTMPIWVINKKIRGAKNTIPTATELEEMRNRLLYQINLLKKKK